MTRLGKSRLLILCFIFMFVLAMVAGCGTQQSPSQEKTTADQSSVKPEANKAEAPKEETKAAAQKHYTFGSSYMTLNNPQFLDWSKGFKSVFDPKGDKLVEADSQLNLSKQIADIEDLIAQKCDLIFFSAVDSKGIKPALLAAQKAGIPMIACDIPTQKEDVDLVATTVATDNVMAGRLAAEAIIKVMNKKANIGIIDWNVVQSVVDRDDGFLAAIKPFPDLKVVVRQNASASTESALPLMENFLQSNPEMNAVFCINDPSATGALAACEAAKRTDIKIFSVDGSQDGIKLVKQGKIVGTSAQFPVKMGETAANAAYKILAGEKVEKNTLVESAWIDSSNADQYVRK